MLDLIVGKLKQCIMRSSTEAMNLTVDFVL